MLAHNLGAIAGTCHRKNYLSTKRRDELSRNLCLTMLISPNLNDFERLMFRIVLINMIYSEV